MEIARVQALMGHVLINVLWDNIGAVPKMISVHFVNLDTFVLMANLGRFVKTILIKMLLVPFRVYLVRATWYFHYIY